MTEAEVVRWFDRVAGVLAGLVLGLGWSLAITWRLVGLGARMGTEVMRASRLSTHTSREYQNLKQRIERLERMVQVRQGDDLEEGS
jgi:predicted alpha/beta hydrolase